MSNEFEILLAHLDIKAESKKPAEDPNDAKLRRRKEWCLFVLTLFVILCTFLGLTFLAFYRTESPQNNMALNGLMSLTMALAGYYVGGKSNAMV